MQERPAPHWAGAGVEIVDEDLRTVRFPGNGDQGGFRAHGFSENAWSSKGEVAARSIAICSAISREWQKLVEVCRVVDTLP